MKKVESSNSHVGSSFGEISMIKSEKDLGAAAPASVRKQIPNKLKINFDSSAKKPGMISYTFQKISYR